MAIYTCSYQNCNKTFRRPSKLKNHYNQHNGIKPFTCAIPGCDKSYSSSSHLQRHMKCSHGEPSSCKTVFACSHKSCDATFQTLWGLQRHEKNHLTSFFCEKCNFWFKTSALFDKHTKRHETVANRKCRVCGEDFAHKLKQDLLRHEKTHNDYICEICCKRFLSVKEFQRHMVIHESQFQCAHCGFITKTKNSLRTHIRSLHMEFSEPYVCEKVNCSKIYHYKRNCAKHLQLHDEKYRFKCPVTNCCQEFLHKKSYQYHLHLHQNNKMKIKPKKISKANDIAIKLVNALCS